MDNGKKRPCDDKFVLKHSMTLCLNIEESFKITSKCCILCCTNFTTQKEYLEDLRNHIKQESIFNFNRALWAVAPEMEIHMDIIEAHCMENDIKLVLNSFSNETVVLRVFIYCANEKVVFIDSDKWPQQLNCEPTLMSINRNIFTAVPFKYQLFIHFQINNSVYLERYELQVKKLKTRIRKKMVFGKMKQFFPLQSTEKLFKNNYKIFNGIKENEKALLNIITETQIKPKYEKLNIDNYEFLLSRLVEMEELECSKLLKEYDGYNQKFELVQNNYVLKVENLSENRPSVLVYDQVVVTSEKDDRITTGMVVDVKADRVIIEFDKDINIKHLYKVEFKINRNTFRLERNAISLSQSKSLSRLLFPQKYKPTFHIGKESFNYCNESIKTNIEQQIAVKNVYNGMAYPLPYIIFGPPGTGKTTTVVECILQLWINMPKANILIAASSNSACNEVAMRLIKVIPNHQVLRLFSKSQEKCIDKIDDEIIEASNLDEYDHYFPSIEELYQYRVVLATLTTAGRLVQANCKTNHFTHLFIDECGCSTEASAIIPISGLLSEVGRFTGYIILSGDPLQLGTVTHSKMAKSLGYGTSLLERLMNLDVYKKDDLTQEYNNNIIIKLKQNFRSHPALLHLSNTMFYDNELIPLAPKEQVEWALGWKYLVNRNFPMFFKSVIGRAQREPSSPSWFNVKEIDNVIKYVGHLVNTTINNKKITEADIGIISPYRKQCQKIRDQCIKNNWSNIEVASVESFQGAEKSIIILSTVRAQSRSIGFLDNPKRLNVALTRAMGLLIIIGDPNVLKTDRHWKKVLRYCAENKAITGEPFKL